ncbi:putative inorganic carbon transporter subunit DabA [Iodobacter sp. LRB]
MMTTVTKRISSVAQIHNAALQACERIAPAWPLDQSIAVNPWWKMRDQSMDKIAAKLQVLGGVNLLMPKSYYLSHWQTTIKSEHLSKAADEMGVNASEQALLALLETAETGRHWLNICDLLDAEPIHGHKMPWRDEIVQQISQFTALYFQYPEQMQHGDDADNGLYQAWLEVIRQDRGIEVLMSEAGLSHRFAALPDRADQLFAQVHDVLFAHSEKDVVFVDYCYALLMDVHGWASWLAYGAWQDAFASKTNSLLLQLLAIRMAWDWAVWQQVQNGTCSTTINRAFELQIKQLGALEHNWHAQQKLLWVWQRALEYSYQQPLQSQLLSAVPHSQTQLQLQAIFCIDVRSEPMRRALEAQSDEIQTIGFAGFFGLPIEYSVAGSKYSRPQLPGLLKPSIRAEQKGSANSRQAVANQIKGQVAGKLADDAASAMFGLVEAKGLFRAVNLVKKTFFPAKASHSIA